MLILACASILLSCATTGPGGEKSLIIIPPAQEVAIGQGMAEQVVQTEKPLADTAWQKYLDEIGQKIVKVSDRTDIEYHFTVIESDQINAFAAPGGYIFFYTGLLRRMTNESEMATVLAHEISHVVARHGVKRIQATLGVAVAYKLVFGDNAGEVLSLAVNVGMGLLFAGYSRDNEREADDFGLQYLVKAGYDPRGALSMFEILAVAGGSGSSNVFEKLSRSHPETKERIQNIEAEIASMQPLRSGLVLGERRFGEMLKRLESGPQRSK